MMFRWVIERRFWNVYEALRLVLDADDYDCDELRFGEILEGMNRIYRGMYVKFV